MDSTINNFEHYFDWAATSPTDEDIAKEALNETLNCWGNPSSGHTIGKNARKIFEDARNRAANAMGVPSNTIYFTSGGTESDQIALLSVLNKPAKGSVLVSSIEHPALREQVEAIKKLGWTVKLIPANSDGIITPQAVTELLTNDTMFVTVMAVNNETGVIQPIYEIADAISKWAEGRRKPKFHVDCVQAAGKIPLNLSYKGIDSAALSSHKICGPRGIGILYLKDKLEPFLRGGGQENNIRSGTENVFGAVAFSKCLERYYLKNEESTDISEKSKFHQFKQEYSNKFIQNLLTLNGCTIVPESRGKDFEKNISNFSPYVVQVAFKNIPGNVMLRALDSKGFYISTGSACSTKKANRPVLEAMHVSADLRETAVRFSFGPKTSEKAINDLFEAVKEINNQFNKSK